MGEVALLAIVASGQLWREEIGAERCGSEVEREISGGEGEAEEAAVMLPLPLLLNDENREQWR